MDEEDQSLPGLAEIVGQQGLPTPNEEIYDPQVYQIMNEMDLIGWRHLCFGAVPKCWTKY